MAAARKKVSYEARTAMLNARNREARKRRGLKTGPLVWCERNQSGYHVISQCGRCGPRKVYVGLQS